jgi:hypothetical protein
VTVLDTTDAAKCSTYAFTIVAEDADDFPYELTWFMERDPDMPEPNCDTGSLYPQADYEDLFTDNGDGTMDFEFHACSHFVPPRIHDMTFTYTFIVTDKCDKADTIALTFNLD